MTSRSVLTLMVMAGGCAEKSSDSAVEDEYWCEAVQPSDSGDPVGMTFSASWLSLDIFDLSISNGAPAYWLGMAETGAGGDGWYGEDCSTGDYCHPAGTSGVTLTSVHPQVGGAGLGELVGGETTLMWAGLDGAITYALVDGETTECWAWGHDSGYYAMCGAI